jgi:DNA-binding MurR/RpiR family transcriptional regulator
LSSALRKFADLVLDDPVGVARMSMHSAVEVVGVSVATANRFARAIGFDGYAAFRAELIQGLAPAFEPVERLASSISKGSTSPEIIAASLAECMRNLELTSKEINQTDCTRAIDLILAANQKLILGFDNSAYLAGLFANGLDRYCEGARAVSSLNGALGAARQLYRLGRDDLVIAIAFPRYFRETVELARLATECSVPLLAITDGPRSPLASIADVTLYVSSRSEFASTSDAATLALIEALTAAIATRATKSIDSAEKFTAFALPWFEPLQRSNRTMTKNLSKRRS